MPKVLNKRTDTIPPEAVYVGRPSNWGNPFLLGRDGNREEVIAKFREWILYDYYGRTLFYNLEQLKGKDLVCWCSPLPCHADILLELANK